MKQLQKEIHKTAVRSGWWDNPRSPLEIHMLIVSEIAEATEAARKAVGNSQLEEAKELADAVIRIMDYCEYLGWDLEGLIKTKHEFNKTRPYRHGGKKY